MRALRVAETCRMTNELSTSASNAIQPSVPTRLPRPPSRARRTGTPTARSASGSAPTAETFRPSAAAPNSMATIAAPAAADQTASSDQGRDDGDDQRGETLDDTVGDPEPGGVRDAQSGKQGRRPPPSLACEPAAGGPCRIDPASNRWEGEARHTCASSLLRPWAMDSFLLDLGPVSLTDNRTCRHTRTFWDVRTPRTVRQGRDDSSTPRASIRVTRTARSGPAPCYRLSATRHPWWRPPRPARQEARASVRFSFA